MSNKLSKELLEKVIKSQCLVKNFYKKGDTSKIDCPIVELIEIGEKKIVCVCTSLKDTPDFNESRFFEVFTKRANKFSFLELKKNKQLLEKFIESLS